MWYEILPSLLTIGAAVTIPGLLMPYLSQLFHNGKPCARKLLDQEDMLYYFRDKRLSGNAYALKGLENLPDADK